MRSTVMPPCVAFVVLMLVLALVLAGCADGNPYLLGTGEARWYFTLDACEQEATARYRDGGPVYSGYECRSRFLGFVTGTRAYYMGQRTR